MVCSTNDAATRPTAIQRRLLFTPAAWGRGRAPLRWRQSHNRPFDTQTPRDASAHRLSEFPGRGTAFAPLLTCQAPRIPRPRAARWHWRLALGRTDRSALGLFGIEPRRSGRRRSRHADRFMAWRVHFAEPATPRCPRAADRTSAVGQRRAHAWRHGSVLPGFRRYGAPLRPVDGPEDDGAARALGLCEPQRLPRARDHLLRCRGRLETGRPQRCLEPRCRHALACRQTQEQWWYRERRHLRR